MQYRRDIDGLRALAILGVLFFHITPKLLPGGFVGVDVFFVISGFLITSIINQQIDEQKFSIIEFYKRRINRLFPSLIFFLLIFSVLAWLYFLRSDFQNYLKHLFATTLFAGNFSHYFEIDYYNKDAVYKPLLHLWSLAIEEQFYLLWPVIFLIFKKFRQPLLGVLTLLVFSFSIAVWRQNVNSQEVFYLLHGRFWELLFGCGLAFFLKNKNLKSSPKLNIALSLTGIILILYAFLRFSIFQYDPWKALIPVFGTCLIIFSNYFVESRPLEYIGKISYPLYIWHWAIFSFCSLCNIGDIDTKLITIFGSLFFAIISYELIEKPLKHKFNLRLLISLLSIAVVSLFCLKLNLHPYNSNPQLDAIWKATEDRDPMPATLDPVYSPNSPEFWKMGHGKEKVLVMGDSYGQMFLFYFEKMADLNRFTIFSTSKGGCPVLPRVSLKDNRFNEGKDLCADRLKFAIRQADELKIDKIVITTEWLLYFRKYTSAYMDHPDITLEPGTLGFQGALYNLQQVIRTLTTNGKKVFVIGPIPTGKEFVPESMITRNMPIPKVEIRYPEFPLDRFLKENQMAMNGLKKASQEAGAIYIDPIPDLCPNSKCTSVTKDFQPTYWNYSHMRPFYVIERGSFLKKIFE